MTAKAAATTVRASRVPSARRRPRHNAHAAKHAAAAAECPLGNDIPENGASGPMAGRGRWTMLFTRLFASPTPATVTRRKRITPRDRVRSTSTTATIAVITSTTLVLPRSVNRRRTWVLVWVAWCDAQMATWRSARTTNDCRRTSNASVATAINKARATVSARPVTRAGLKRSRTNVAMARCSASWRCVARAVACTGPCVTLVVSRCSTRNTTSAITPATRPAAKNTTSTSIGPPSGVEHCGCSRELASATAGCSSEETKP